MGRAGFHWKNPAAVRLLKREKRRKSLGRPLADIVAEFRAEAGHEVRTLVDHGQPADLAAALRKAELEALYRDTPTRGLIPAKPR